MPAPEEIEIPLKKSPGGEYGDLVEVHVTQLMSATKRGDQAAFNELVCTLRGRAFSVARGLVGSRDDALELTQEAFLKTYRARETYRDGDPFLPWFHRILRNTCFSFLRKRNRLKAHSLTVGSEGEETEWEIVDEAGPVSEGLERSEAVAAFQAAFERLAARDREILSLRHFEELSYREIAHALEIPEGTVMSRLFHARRRLRDLLLPHLEDALNDYAAALPSRPESRGGPK